jgi:hypothetical protein
MCVCVCVCVCVFARYVVYACMQCGNMCCMLAAPCKHVGQQACACVEEGSVPVYAYVSVCWCMHVSVCVCGWVPVVVCAHVLVGAP